MWLAAMQPGENSAVSQSWEELDRLVLAEETLNLQPARWMHAGTDLVPACSFHHQYLLVTDV